MSGENEAAATPAATPSETASPERAGASAPVDGGQPGEGAPANGEHSAEAQPQQGGDGQPQKPTPDHRTVQGRISHYQKETTREREARIRAEAERDTLARLLANGTQRTEQPEPQQAAAPELAPNPASYRGGEFDPQYLKDVAKWEGREAVREALAEDARKRAEQERNSAVEAALRQGHQRLERTLEAAIAEADGDNGEHFQNAPRVLDLAFVPVSQGGLPRHVVDLITESANPVHVAEVLGRQPDRLRQLRTLNPIQAAKHIGALDAQIGANLQRQAQPAPAARPAPQPSPAPIPTVLPNGAAPSFDPNKGTMEDFVRWRNGG